MNGLCSSRLSCLPQATLAHQWGSQNRGDALPSQMLPCCCGEEKYKASMPHPCSAVPAVGHCAAMGESRHGRNHHCDLESGRALWEPSRGLLRDSPCGLSTSVLQEVSQPCSKASQLPAVCLSVPPSKGFSSWKLFLHQVLVRKPLAGTSRPPAARAAPSTPLSTPPDAQLQQTLSRAD